MFDQSDSESPFPAESSFPAEPVFLPETTVAAEPPATRRESASVFPPAGSEDEFPHEAPEAHGASLFDVQSPFVPLPPPQVRLAVPRPEEMPRTEPATRRTVGIGIIVIASMLVGGGVALLMRNVMVKGMARIASGASRASTTSPGSSASASGAPSGSPDLTVAASPATSEPVTPPAAAPSGDQSAQVPDTHPANPPVVSDLPMVPRDEPARGSPSPVRLSPAAARAAEPSTVRQEQPPVLTLKVPTSTMPIVGGSALVVPNLGASSAPEAPAQPNAPAVPASDRAAVSPAATPSAATGAATPQAAVRAVIEQYRDAYDHLNIDGVVATWPTANVKALTRAFEQLAQQHLAFTACAVFPNRVTATASCTGTAMYVPAVGSRTEHLTPRDWTFQLSLIGGRWTINSVDVR